MLNKYGEVFENFSLENYNTYGIKVKTKYLVKPNNLDNLKDLISYINENNLKYFILGRGSNVILPDNDFSGIIISLENLCNIIFNDNKVYAESGILLSKFAILCIDNSLEGLEYLAGIPGTLGGALYGNAGVKDIDIYKYLENIIILRDDKIIEINKEDIEYSYRNTCFKETKDIIVGANFIFNKGKKEELQEIVKESRIKRLNSQPLEYKNAGSVFKNPTGNYAGKLIEDLGLKGYTIGDAQISEKHANFIINKGNATSSDIKKLINYIKEKVYEEYKIELELEQIIVEWE